MKFNKLCCQIIVLPLEKITTYAEIVYFLCCLKSIIHCNRKSLGLMGHMGYLSKFSNKKHNKTNINLTLSLNLKHIWSTCQQVPRSTVLMIQMQTNNPFLVVFDNIEASCHCAPNQPSTSCSFNLKIIKLQCVLSNMCNPIQANIQTLKRVVLCFRLAAAQGRAALFALWQNNFRTEVEVIIFMNRQDNNF